MNRESIIGLTVAFFTLLFVYWQSNGGKTAANESNVNLNKPLYNVGYGTPLINGVSDDAIWENVEWHALDQVWLGAAPTPEDFSGRYKIAWDENNLYLLAEIADDTLIDIYQDGLQRFWDDDCLEVFLDEDASGGDHQYNYSAFAYHIALDGRVVDTRPDKNAGYFDDHCISRRKSEGKVSTWEVAIKVFSGKKYEEGGENIPMLLKSGKKMGFALAYCDNDHSAERENFVGSIFIDGDDKNRGWIDASVFGLLVLE